MSYQNLLLEKRDGVAILTVNRPDKLNALNDQVMAELADAVERIATEREVRGVILTGAGTKAFVAGADIGDLAQQGPFDGKARALRGQGVLRRLETCGKPVIAAVNGYALGGGCELALACDIRIASDRARIGQPEVNIGIIPGFGGSQRLPRLVGAGWAAEMIFTGDPVDAATAERIGLVNRVVPPAELLDEARALARKVLEKGAAAIALAKACLRASQEMPLSAGLDFETAAFGVVGSTQDKAEGMKAFIEKRKPAWTGT